MGSKAPVHPIDHVNKNQRSDHLFSSVMNIAVIGKLNCQLYPALDHLQKALEKKSKDFSSMSTISQTHLRDAVPTTLYQKFSGYTHQIFMNIERLNTCQSSLCQLAIDDTAVGTEINAQKAFGESVAECLAGLTNFPFINVRNKFEELNTYNIMVELSGALNTLAVTLMKIANDIRLLDSRSRYGESILSENETGSSIMLDEVNPTQYEAMTMVAAEVMINHVVVTVGVSMGNFELNVFKPLLIKNILHSIHTLCDACYSFTDHLIVGIKLTRPTTSTPGELGSNDKDGRPEKFIPDLSSSSANEKVFGNVHGSRLTAPTTQTDYNKYYKEGEELIITTDSNPACQPGDPSSSSSYNDESMAQLRHSTPTSNNNLHQVSSGQQQQPFVSTTPAHHSQGITRRSISASPSRSTKLLTNNNFIKDKPLDMNGEPNSPISNMESPLISMMQIINNLPSSGSQYNSSKNNRSKQSNNVRPTPPMHPSHHPMQSNNVRPPPPPQQQQTEEQLIKNLAEELKAYPPRH